MDFMSNIVKALEGNFTIVMQHANGLQSSIGILLENTLLN
jgi:hypothetical protein